MTDKGQWQERELKEFILTAPFDNDDEIFEKGEKRHIWDLAAMETLSWCLYHL